MTPPSPELLRTIPRDYEIVSLPETRQPKRWSSNNRVLGVVNLLKWREVLFSWDIVPGCTALEPSPANNVSGSFRLLNVQSRRLNRFLRTSDMTLEGGSDYQWENNAGQADNVHHQIDVEPGYHYLCLPVVERATIEWGFSFTEHPSRFQSGLRRFLTLLTAKPGLDLPVWRMVFTAKPVYLAAAFMVIRTPESGTGTGT